MRITGLDVVAVHVNHRGDWAFVGVDTDGGIRGTGELRAGVGYGGRVQAVREMESGLVGRDPLRIARIVSDFAPRAADRDRVCALSAVEQALWDIAGKALGVPVCTLFGGPVRDEVRLYANINRATVDRTPGGFARNAAAAVAEGFGAVKLAPFDGMPDGVDRASDAATGITCLEAVREAVGPGVDLLVDCHCRFTAKGAVEVADALRDLDLFWFEQPVPESDPDTCRRVRDGCGLRIAGGEQRMFRQGFREVVEGKTMDVVMPDVTVVGGLGELMKVADMAEAWGIPTSPHGPFGPFAIAAGVQAMAAHPGFLVLEFGWGEVPWRSALTTPPEQIDGGRIRLTDRPGLGFDLNPDVVESHLVEV